jgi:hypothetical protein
MNNKKRAIVYREGLESDEEEVEDLRVVEKIEEIRCATYERNKRGPRAGTEGRNPIHVSVSVEPITPCATSTPERTPSFRKPHFSGIKTTRSTSKPGTTIGGSCYNEIFTPRYLALSVLSVI